ncbi:MAG: S24 family peptidase [Sporichthyaceae bacterium]|nr:S24 family peptidase [Sporichthyaceae bacterium]
MPARHEARGWGTARVRGRSMAPTLADGDLLLVRFGRTPRPGELVVVRLPGNRPLSVKRVAHRAADGWWVERDNPAEGVDSWLVGAISDADVVAVVRARLWPLRRLGPRPAAGE